MSKSISQTLSDLADHVAQAEKAQEAGKEGRKLRDTLSRASSVLTEWAGISVNGDVLRYFVDSAVSDLNVSVDGFDKDSGNADARRVTGILMADLIEDEAQAQAARDLVDKWSALTRSGRQGTRRGESTTPDLGFTVKVKDEATGDIVASTTKANLNSLRDQIRKHHEKAHGSRPSKGEPTWQGITDALKAVMTDGVQSAQGGGYLVDKAAA